MSSITGKSIRDGIVIISTEGYFNKDLGEALKAVSDFKFFLGPSPHDTDKTTIIKVKLLIRYMLEFYIDL